MASWPVVGRYGLGAATLAVIFAGLGGCAAQFPVKGTLKAPGWLVGVANEYDGAQAFDQGMTAIGRNNLVGEEQAAAALRRLPLPFLADRYGSALLHDGESLYAQSSTAPLWEAVQLESRAGREIRLGLQSAPDFTSDDPAELNSIGYYLADQGKSAFEFQQAERLLRRADGLNQEQVSTLPTGSVARERAEYDRAHGTEDSLAWALLHQGKPDEAKTLEDEACATLKSLGPALGLPSSEPELLEHRQVIDAAATLPAPSYLAPPKPVPAPHVPRPAGLALRSPLPGVGA